MTKREMFVAIANVPEVAANEEMVKFLEHQVELLDNRKSGSGERKPTEKQKQNEGIKAEIRSILENGSLTCGEIVKALESRLDMALTSQRVSALLSQMGEKGSREVTKTMEKKVAYFSLNAA